MFMQVCYSRFVIGAYARVIGAYKRLTGEFVPIELARFIDAQGLKEIASKARDGVVPVRRPTTPAQY